MWAAGPNKSLGGKLLLKQFLYYIYDRKIKTKEQEENVQKVKRFLVLYVSRKCFTLKLRFRCCFAVTGFRDFLYLGMSSVHYIQNIKYQTYPPYQLL